MNRRGTEPYARWCERPREQSLCLLDAEGKNEKAFDEINLFQRTSDFEIVFIETPTTSLVDTKRILKKMLTVE